MSIFKKWWDKLTKTANRDLTRSERRRIESGADTEQDLFERRLAENKPIADGVTKEFHEIVYNLGYKLLPVLEYTNTGIHPNIKLLPVSLDEWNEIEKKRVDRENGVKEKKPKPKVDEKEATKGEDKTINTLQNDDSK